jgi:hypothetical protein
MTARLGVAFVLLLCVGGFGLASAINQFAIVDAVNAKLRADDQFDAIGWWPPKTLRLHMQYRRLYPNGGLLRRQGILVAAMHFCLVVAASLIGFGALLIAWIGVGGAFLLWFSYFRKSGTG